MQFPGDARPADRRRLPLSGLAILLGIAILAVVVALVVGAGRPRWPAAVGFAMAACLPGAVLGWVLGRLPTKDPARAVANSLASVTLRILPPLVALGWLSSTGQSLREAGAGGLLVAFYLALLATDLLLHVAGGKAAAGNSNAPH